MDRVPSGGDRARAGERAWGIATASFVGDPEGGLARCRPLHLDPLAQHTAHHKRLDDAGARATLKQLARIGEAPGLGWLGGTPGVVARATPAFHRRHPPELIHEPEQTLMLGMIPVGAGPGIGVPVAGR